MTTLSGSSHGGGRCWDAPDLRKSGHRRKASKNAFESTACDRVAELTRTIESEIIPRLLLINTAPQQPAGLCHDEKKVDPAVIDELTRIIVRQQLDQALHLIEALRVGGMSLEVVFLELLPPVARRLGEAWESDELSFVEVTIGLSRLQQVLRELSPSFESLREDAGHDHRVVLMAAAGEQHSLGLFTVEVYFRRAGWDVVSGAGRNVEDVAAAIGRQWVDVIGITKSCGDLLDGLASDIRIMRRRSRNKNLTVMVGGRAFDGHPERVALVGADTTAIDGQQAVLQAVRSIRVKQQKRA